MNAVLSLLLLSVSLASAGSATLGDRVLQRYESQCTCGVHGQWTLLRGTMTEDYRSVDVAGKSVDRSGAVAAAKAAFQQYGFYSCATKIVRIRQTGDAIIADIIESTNGSVDGKPLRIVERMTDTWTGKNGTMMIRESVTHELWAYGNGRLLQHVKERQ